MVVYVLRIIVKSLIKVPIYYDNMMMERNCSIWLFIVVYAAVLLFY